ncbi:MAG: hypothetical protein N2515_02235 [Deltaproteobacteria bacterium]|nr:hypothetical protein [Deltaproteobacteria bacterium]
MLGWLIVCLGTLGCGVGGLDSPTIVKTPRILAIIAEPPESFPGSEIRVGVLAHSPDDPEGENLRYRWRLCVSLRRVLSITGIPGDGAGADRCEELPATGPVAVIPGEATRELVRTIENLPQTGRLDPRFLLAVLATAGLPFEVEVDVLDAGGKILVRGTKIVAITTRMPPLPPPTTNPPPIVYKLGDGVEGPEVDVDVVMPPDPFDFRWWLPNGPVRFPQDTQVTIQPISGADWTESYPIWDYSGQVQLGKENEYYSFYVTHGGLSKETTRPPEREVLWRTPKEARTVRLWLVVRDGHLGSRACRVDVQVGE